MTTFLLLGVLPIAGAWLLVELHRAACRFVDNAVAAALDTSWDDHVAEAVALCEPDQSGLERLLDVLMDDEKFRAEIKKLEAS